MHLETIIKDLRERFARVEVRVSPPLVAFRESVYILEEAPEPQHKPAKVLPELNNACIFENAALRRHTRIWNGKPQHEWKVCL